VLAFVALMGLKPWEDDAVEPHLTLPGVEVAVGDAVALPTGSAVAVANRTVVRAEAEPVAASRPPAEVEGREPALAVAPLRVVAGARIPVAPGEPEVEARPGDEVPSVGATDGEAPPEGTSSPASMPSPVPGNPGPTTAVLESCEGDEYVITVVLVPGADEGGEAEEASVEIVLQRFNEDGSVDELKLEGDALDAENLALQLSSEGNCVLLEADVPVEEGVPSDGTSQAVVPAEGTPSSAATPASP